MQVKIPHHIGAKIRKRKGKKNQKHRKQGKTHTPPPPRSPIPKSKTTYAQLWVTTQELINIPFTVKCACHTDSNPRIYCSTGTCQKCHAEILRSEDLYGSRVRIPKDWKHPLDFRITAQRVSNWWQTKFPGSGDTYVWPNSGWNLPEFLKPRPRSRNSESSTQIPNTADISSHPPPQTSHNQPEKRTRIETPHTLFNPPARKKRKKSRSC